MLQTYYGPEPQMTSQLRLREPKALELQEIPGDYPCRTMTTPIATMHTTCTR